MRPTVNVRKLKYQVQRKFISFGVKYLIPMKIFDLNVIHYNKINAVRWNVFK